MFYAQFSKGGAQKALIDVEICALYIQGVYHFV